MKSSYHRVTGFPPKFRRKEIFLLSLVFALGVFLRLYKINQIPPGLHGDEAQSGLEAIKILKGTPYSPYSAEVYGQTTLYFYLTAGVFKVLGISAASIRFTSAILGILTLPLFYLFVREALGRAPALFTIFLLSVSRWHLHLSRLGLMSVMMTLFQTGFFLFFLKGLKTKKLPPWVLAGLFFSLGLNSYMGFRLVPFTILAMIIFLLLTKRKIIKKNYFGLLVFFLIAISLSLPLLHYAYHHWDTFNGRMHSIWIFNHQPTPKALSVLWQNLKGALISFHFRGSTWPHKNLPGAPLLDPISGFFFLVGLSIVLRRIRKPVFFLLLVNLVVMAVASIFSEPTYPPTLDPIRSSGALISAIVLTGVGANFFWQKTKKANWLLIPILILAFFFNTYAYFFQFAHHPAVWYDFHFVPCEVAQLANQNPDSHPYLLSDWFYVDYLSIRFLAPNSGGENFFKKLGQYSPKSLPLKKNLEKNALFVILPFYQPFLSELKANYPQGETKEHFGGPEKKLIFTTFSVPNEALKEKVL